MAFGKISFLVSRPPNLDFRWFLHILGKIKLYIFSPFSLIQNILKKLKLECVVVVPLWSSQQWFPKLLKLLVQHYIMLPNIVLIQNTRKHTYSFLLDSPKANYMQLSRTNLSCKGILEQAKQCFLSQYELYIAKQFRNGKLLCIKQQIIYLEPSLSNGLGFLTEKWKNRCKYGALIYNGSTLSRVINIDYKLFR